MSELPPAEAHGQSLIDHFAQRVALRDVPPPPEPLHMDPASMQARIRAAVLRRLQPREPRLTLFTELLYGYLTQPRFSSDTAAALTGYDPANMVRAWRVLLAAGLVQRHHQSHARYYTLSRAGEDWLLAVVKGEEPNQIN